MTDAKPCRRWLALGVAAVLCGCPALTRAASGAPGAAPRRPNIVVLFADDLTFRALGAVGQLEVKTPHIDRLARRGTMFTHAFIEGGTSGAVCMASRAMLMTGRHLWACGKNADCTSDGKAIYPLWGQVLGDAGYRTFAIGKWHNGEATRAKGFQEAGPGFLGGMLESTKTDGPAYRRPAPGNPWTPDDPKWKGHWLTVDGKTVHSSTRWADAAIAYLKSAAGDDHPFFLYVAFDTPHDPRQAPRPYLDMYPADSLAVPPNFVPRHPFDLQGFEGRDEILAPYPRTRAIVQTHLREYYAIISHLDAEVGRVLDALDRSGKADETLVIFSADNGLAVGQHGLMGKQSLYDHSIRVPLIVAGPGIPAGKRVDAMVYIQSLFATTSELAGVPVPETVQLPSLVPLIKGRTTRMYEDVYGGFVNVQRMVRTDRLKLVITPGAGMVQLFDVRDDPWEMHDLACDPRHAGAIDELYGRLKAWMRTVHDPMPVARLDATLEAFRKGR